MNESEWTSRLLKDLRAAMPDAVVIKHCNPYTKGVPDFSITRPSHGTAYRTTWIEVKLATNGKMFEPIQVETAKRMGAWYLIWSPIRSKGYLFRADEIDMKHPQKWMLKKRLSYADLIERLVRML